MNIQGQGAIVTGAAAGIGQALAWALAENGATGIALADIDVAGLEQTAAGVRERGAESSTARVDVTDLGQLEKLFNDADRQFGVRLVFNNAGIMAGDPQWPATTAARIAQVVSVNLTAVMVGTRLAIDLLAARGGGVVVNTASVASFGPMPNDPMYSATKAGVVNFTQSCASLAASHGVRVNAVLPGVTDTAIIAKSGDGTKPAEWLGPLLTQVVKLTPADIAAGALTLVQDDSAAGRALVVTNPSAAGQPPVVVALNDNSAFHAMAGRG